MTEIEIITKAIRKAEVNGLDTRFLYQFGEDPYYPMEIIFRHDFAKAFWKKEGNWKYHLMQAVLKRKPINYLKKFL